MDANKIKELDSLYKEATDIPIALAGSMSRHAEAQELFMSEIVEAWPEISAALKIAYSSRPQTTGSPEQWPMQT